MRTEPDRSGPELLLLSQLLDHHRATLLLKTDGLTREQLATPLPPSDMTLAGLVHHLAYVEDWWFGVRFAGLPEDDIWTGYDWDADPDAEWHSATSLEPDVLRSRYEGACAASRAVVERAGTDLDALSAGEGRDGRRWSLRWIFLHMIEETARHNGHADLLRQNVDGSTGE